MLDRRKLLQSTAALGALGLFAPGMAFAQTAATAKRLFVVVQRGAADGLGTIAPIGDPGFTRLRGQWLDSYSEARKLDSIFALHPALKRIGAMYGKGDALFAHAVATTYRERSHFDGQNLLETGGTRAYEHDDGWLNRLLGLLPQDDFSALALAPTVPMALRGPNRVTSYAPSALPDASSQLMERITMLYAGDEQLHSLWESAQATREMAGDTGLRNLRNAKATGELAASLMRDDDGARLMMFDSPGWDSHANQPGQLNRNLTTLDTLLGAYRDGMGELWKDTLVLVATEFGRTAAINGTNGTDHGTASAAMLLGGSVRGGRVVADWPGLRSQDLYEERDLMPTTSLEAVLASSVAGHFGIDPARALLALFPGRTLKPVGGLV